jgi:hypothetical protein
MPTTTTAISPPDTSLTLAEVKAQFEHWRATRSKVCKIPEDLWDSVKQLTRQYGHGQIAAELGLSSKQLRSKLQSVNADHQRGKELSDPAKAEFVAATFAPPASYSAPQSPTLELSRPDGTVLRAMGLGAQETLALVERFLR